MDDVHDRETHNHGFDSNVVPLSQVWQNSGQCLHVSSVIEDGDAGLARVSIHVAVGQISEHVLVETFPLEMLAGGFASMSVAGR